MCSLSGKEKHNQETSRQFASKQNTDATKRKIHPTMGFIRGEKKALVLPFVNGASWKLMPTMLMLIYPFFNSCGSMTAPNKHCWQELCWFNIL